MRKTMYKYGVLVINFLLVTVTVGDPDVFPSDEDCSFVNCRNNYTNHTCCSNDAHKPVSDDSSIASTTAAIFFVAVIGSLLTVICMMFFCMNCEKMCNRLYKKGHASGQRSSVDTVSAAVQTNSEASPPPYAVLDLYQCPCTLMEDGVVFEMHIPRCPSYVKDPPNYLDAIHSDEVTVTVQNETEENDTAIEFSVDSSAVA